MAARTAGLRARQTCVCAPRAYIHVDGRQLQGGRPLPPGWTSIDVAALLAPFVDPPDGSDRDAVEDLDVVDVGSRVDEQPVGDVDAAVPQPCPGSCERCRAPVLLVALEQDTGRVALAPRELGEQLAATEVVYAVSEAGYSRPTTLRGRRPGDALHRAHAAACAAA